jgi:hypothetical protein
MHHLAKLILCTVVALGLTGADADEEMPKDAVAIPGVAAHVLIQAPKSDEPAAYRRPVFIGVSDNARPDWLIHQRVQQELSGHVAMTVLGVTPEDTGKAMTNLLAYVKENAEQWGANPDVIFFHMSGKGYWNEMANVAKAHPEQVRGWLVSCGWFDDVAYPVEGIGSDQIMGITYHANDLKNWQTFIDASFASGATVYDIPIVEEGDNYFLSAKRTEKMFKLIPWMCYAWFHWHAVEAERVAYESTLRPVVKTKRPIGQKVVTPNDEALVLLEDMLFWPGIDQVPWYEQIAEHRLALVAADYTWLGATGDTLQSYRDAFLLMENKDWKRTNKDEYQSTREASKALADTKDKDLRAHYKSYEKFAEAYEQFWSGADDPRKLVKLIPAFKKLAEIFMQQRGGHEARDVAWRIEGFATGLWHRQMRLPKAP